MKFSHVVLALVATVPAVTTPTRADQALGGPMIGRATISVVETTCPNVGPCETKIFLTQKLSMGTAPNVEVFTRDGMCSGFASLPDAMASSCSPVSYLGPCTKTTHSYSSIGPSGFVNGTVYSCTDDHTGRCKSVSGHFNSQGVLVIDSVLASGGCQY